MARICFLNPFGTEIYDELIDSTLRPCHGSTDVEIRHLTHAARNIDYYVPKHLVESEIMMAAVEAERDGFDAFVIGCCYDPALTQCRELVDIPVIAPLEASVMLSRLFGHSFAVVTDHRKAVPELRDRVRLYGLEQNCRAVDADRLVHHRHGVGPGGRRQGDVREAARRHAHHRCGDRCDRLHHRVRVTSWRCCAVTPSSPRWSVINPNVMAVKLAEMFADLNATRQYRISRVGYYQQHAARC